MRETEVPPNARALLSSLRAIGYSFEAAVADIVDNSIAAGATSIDIRFPPSGELYIAILDDGSGISPDRLETVMQHGGDGPDAIREASDLGRFGLGLKTASLSQCRRLTVASASGGVLSGAEWDLGRVERTGLWTLGLLDDDDMTGMPCFESLQELDHGTLVVWREFDRALGGEKDPAAQLGHLVDICRSHLGIVFHRFLKPEAGGRAIEISINGSPVAAVDPFLAAKSTQLPAETVIVQGQQVTFTPYILPHRGRLSRRELDDLDGADGLRRSQGFYVYRNRRQIVGATWFRLRGQAELTKLARVRIDIPNALDHLWQVDVKKSTAVPPMEVRDGLRQILDRIGSTSERVITHRGWKQREQEVRLWERLENPGGVNYQINRNHPIVASLLTERTDSAGHHLEQLLKALEMTIPFQAIYVDMAAEREVIPDFAKDEVVEELRTLLAAFLAVARAIGGPVASMAALAKVPLTEPFNRYPDVTKVLIAEVAGA